MNASVMTSWFGCRHAAHGQAFSLTCQRHISCPSTSSCTAAKSNLPECVSQSPAVYPASMTEPTSPLAPAKSPSASDVPPCRCPRDITYVDSSLKPCDKSVGSSYYRASVIVLLRSFWFSTGRKSAVHLVFVPSRAFQFPRTTASMFHTCCSTVRFWAAW